MVRLLIIVLALIVVGVLGTFGLVKFAIIPDFTGLIAPMETENAAAPPAPARENPVFVSVEPFLVPVIGDKRIDHTFYVSLRIQVEPDYEMDMRRIMPRLRDAFRLALAESLPQHMIKRPTVDLKHLKARLLEVAVRGVGDGKIKDVLIESIFER